MIRGLYYFVNKTLVVPHKPRIIGEHLSVVSEIRKFHTVLHGRAMRWHGKTMRDPCKIHGPRSRLLMVATEYRYIVPIHSKITSVSTVKVFRDTRKVTASVAGLGVVISVRTMRGLLLDHSTQSEVCLLRSNQSKKLAR
jgi:hypothetical protein